MESANEDATSTWRCDISQVVVYATCSYLCENPTSTWDDLNCLSDCLRLLESMPFSTQSLAPSAWHSTKKTTGTNGHSKYLKVCRDIVCSLIFCDMLILILMIFHDISITHGFNISYLSPIYILYNKQPYDRWMDRRGEVHRPLRRRSPKMVANSRDLATFLNQLPGQSAAIGDN